MCVASSISTIHPARWNTVWVGRLSPWDRDHSEPTVLKYGMLEWGRCLWLPCTLDRRFHFQQLQSAQRCQLDPGIQKNIMISPTSSNEIETWEGSSADLESIKIYFVQRTVDIGGTVGHCCSVRCADLLPVTKCYPQLSKSSGQWHSPSPRANVEDLVHDEWEGQGKYLMQQHLMIHTKMEKLSQSHCFNLAPSHSSLSWQHTRHTQNTYKRGGEDPNDVKSCEKLHKTSAPVPQDTHNWKREFCLLPSCSCCNETIVTLLLNLITRTKNVERVHLVHPRDRLNHPHHQA